MPITPRQTNPGIPLHSEGLGGGLKELVGEVPPEWRCAIDLSILEQPVPYDTEIPLLSDTILSTRVEQQFTSESILRQVTKPPGIVTLEETYTDKYKQVGSRIKKFRPITDLPLIGLPSATRDVNTKNFGNYHFEETLEDSGTLFTQQEYTVERPDSAPEKFKELLPLTTESHVALGVATLPVLGDSEYIKSEGQQDVYTKKVSTRYRDPINFPAHLDTFRMTPEQQIASGIDTLDDVDLNINDISALTVEAHAEDLGDGTWYKTKFDVPDVFDHTKLVVERDILGNLPAEFRSGISRITASEEIAGIVTLPVLYAGLEYASQEQITEFKKRVEQRAIDLDTLTALTDYRMTPEQQLETITKEVSTSAPTPGSFTALTVESEIRTLGGGLWLQVEGTVPEVFDKQMYSRQRDLLASLPPEFRNRITESIQSSEISGIAAHDLALVGSETFRSEQRVTEFKKKVEIKSIDLSDGEIVLTGKELTEEYGGGILNDIFSLNDSAYTIDEGLLVVSSKTKNLGGGLFSKETKELGLAAWPILSSRLWDENLRVEYDEDKQVVEAGTSEDPDPGGVFGWTSEVKAIDKWRSLKVNISKPTPAYVDEASALVSYAYKPYRFPGYLYVATAVNPYYVRHADAQLVQYLIKTWWEKSSTTPTVVVDEIIMDDVVIGSLNNINSLTYSGPVLHDDLTIGATFYPATTPSSTQYHLGTQTGTTLVNIISLYTPGSAGGYVVGDTITCASLGYSATTHVTSVYDVDTITGLINGLATPASGTFPPGGYGPLGGGGSGSGALFNVSAVMAPTYTPGTQWIGTYRVVGATVTPEKEKDVWKIQTESVIMR
jgi:hypothetical protein